MRRFRAALVASLSGRCWFRDHLDGVARTRLEANRAASAAIIKIAVPPAGSEFLDLLLWARRVALVAFEAIAAGQATFRFVGGFTLVQAAYHLGEASRARRHRQHPLFRTLSITVDWEVQHAERHDRVLRRRPIFIATQPTIDVPRRLLAVPGSCRHGAFAWDHVAAGEDPGMASHHVRIDDDGAIGVEFDTRNLSEEAAVGLLSKRQHNGVSLQRLEVTRWLGPSVWAEFHNLDSQRWTGDFLDACQPFDFDALIERFIRLERASWHVRAVTVVDDQRLFDAEALRGACRIHRGVAAAIDYDAPAEARPFARADAAQKAYGVEHTGCVAGRDIDVLRDMGSNRDERCIKASLFLLGKQVLDLVIKDNLDAHCLNLMHLLHQLLAWQPISRNAKMHHPARQWTSITDLDCVPHACKMVSGG